MNWIPNALTFLRILLIVPFALALLEARYQLALLIFLVAAVTDAVDGFLARHFDWGSRLGAIADPLADKALLMTAYYMLTLTGVFPWWLLAIVIGRDLLIVVGAIAFHYLIGRFHVQPSWAGKVNTFLQILVVLAVIVLLAGWPMPAWVLPAGVWLVGVWGVVSGAHYVVVWARRAWLRTHA